LEKTELQPREFYLNLCTNNVKSCWENGELLSSDYPR
jgi:hypothetical protein